MRSKNATISGWGNYPTANCNLWRPETYASVSTVGETRIARGQGRSYGDAATNADSNVILTERLNRFLAFDEATGILQTEAGATLAEILDVFVPRGWFPMVTPGTKHVSIGGCIAADVHGKNHHHVGSFGDHTPAFELITANGKRRKCKPGNSNKDLFRATVGGMGLTGIIGEASIKLHPIDSAWVIAEHKPASNLEDILAIMEDDTRDDAYSVAWIDCLARGSSMGRSIFMRGHHAALDELPSRHRSEPLKKTPRRQLTVPFNLPGAALNSFSVRAFNRLYNWQQGRKRTPFLCDLDSYFYPLDSIGNWNRIYGRSGFVQYQCALPTDTAHDGLRTLLEKLSDARCGSFLAVLKRFGAHGKGYLSFPQPGYTLALDIPLRHKGLFELLNELDQAVIGCGGRVYLAKDARLSAESFRQMYPEFNAWQKVKQRIDPGNRFSSDLSRRLKLGADDE